MQMADSRWVFSSELEPDPGSPVLCEFDVVTAARSDACVLLTGGKASVEVAARRIHELSAWRSGPFELVHCEWPEAVWDALATRFTEAEPLGQAGTLLLQDVWRVGPVLQSRLADALGWLRADQRWGFRPWRLMASSSRPLLPLVANGTFDDRLFYRLNVLHLVLPDGDTGEVDERRFPRRA
jgi:DNA-binding NtrC family response regulator